MYVAASGWWQQDKVSLLVKKTSAGEASFSPPTTVALIEQARKQAPKPGRLSEPFERLE